MTTEGAYLSIRSKALVRAHLDATPHTWNDWLGADPVPAPR